MKQTIFFRKVRPTILCFGFLLAFLILGQGIMHARTIWVAPNGSSTSNGTSTSSPTSITKAFSIAGSGDVVKIKGGKYSVPNGLNVEASNITFEGYDGMPVLDGINYLKEGIKIVSKDNIKLKGIKVKRFLHGFVLNSSNYTIVENCIADSCSDVNRNDPNTNNNGWNGNGFSMNRCNNLTLRGCSAHDDGGNGIMLKQSTNCLIENCTVKSFQTNNLKNYPDGLGNYNIYYTDYYIVIMWSQNNTIKNCYVDDVNRSGKGNHGIIIKDTPNNGTTHSSGNKIVNCTAKKFEECFSAAHGAFNNTFENCYADNTGKSGGFNTCLMARDGAYNNTFKNCYAIGKTHAVIVYTGAETNKTKTQTGNKFINCVFRNAEAGIFLRSSANTKFENCNFVNFTSLFRFSNYGTNSGTSLLNCILYNVTYKYETTYRNGGGWNGSAINGMAGVAATYTNFWGGFEILSGTGNLSVNPLFISDTDFHLQSTSPVIDKGTTGSFPYDFDSVPRPQGSKWDMGAYEYINSNTPPVANITQIGTSPFNNEKPITFTGNGTDSDGTIKAYRWTSNIDSILGTTATVNNRYLTVGTHVISFMVQDNGGAWSNPAKQTIVVGNANGTTKLSEYFNSTSNSFNPVAGNWTTEENMYNQDATTNASNTNSYASVSQSGKMIYEWDMKFINTGSGGMHIMCSESSSTNRGESYLIFQLPTKIQLYVANGSTLTKLTETTDPKWGVTTNVVYKYKVVYESSTGLINIYRNRELVLSYTLSQKYTTGSYISFRTNNGHVHFDNVIVTAASTCNPPTGTGTISGVTTVCQGTNNVNYTVNGITNATSYVWTLPNGATGSSTTNTISVNYGTSAVSGNISVKGINSCGSSNVANLSITVNTPPTGTGTISGATTVCRGTNNVNYTVNGINNATSYVWTLPNGTTGSSTTNTILVNYGTSAVSGNISVKGVNSCGSGNVASLYITVNTPPTGTGIISGATTVSQGQNSVQYVVSGITNATSYVWTLPNGATGSSTTNTILVNYGASAMSGNISVRGINSCGSTSTASLFITVNTSQTVYYEDFSDGIANNFTSDGGTWTVYNGQYRQSETGNPNTNASIAVSQTGKLTYNWKIKFVNGKSAGVHFYRSSSSKDIGQSYLVFQTATMLQIYRPNGTSLNKKAEAYSSMAVNETHTYSATYDPSTGKIDVYRDGSVNPIVSWTDPAPLASGSYISLRTNSAEALFDNISVGYEYIENFSDGVADNFTSDGGTWTVYNGQYRQSETGNPNTNASVTVLQSGKLAYTWKINFVNGGSAGAHFYRNSSSKDVGQSYLVFQTATKLQIYKPNGTSLNKKAEAYYSMTAGETHSYSATYDPSTGRIDVYRDGSVNPVVSWTDPTPLTSGSYISLRTNSTEALFDDISVMTYNNGLPPSMMVEGGGTNDDINSITDLIENSEDCSYPNPSSSQLTIDYDAAEDDCSNISIYPNPAKDSFTISGVDFGEITVYSLSGQMILNQKINPTDNIIATGNMQGVYIVKIQTTDKSIVKQLIVIE